MKLLPKRKYRELKPAGIGHAGSSNSTPKPKSIAAQLYADWKRRGGK